MNPIVERVTDARRPALRGAPTRGDLLREYVSGKPAPGPVLVIDAGWVVVRFRRMSPQRYFVLVRQPSKRGEVALYFVNWSVRGWRAAQELALFGLRQAVAYAERVRLEEGA